MTCTGQHGEAVPGLCPSTQVSVDWGEWWYVNIWQPLIVQFVLSLLFVLVLHPAYVEAYYRRRRGSWFQRFVKTYVGTSDSPRVSRPLGLVVLYTAQTLASTAAVAMWVWHTYTRKTSEKSRIVMLLLIHIDMVGWAASRLQGGCNIRCLWEISSLVDVVTGVPVLVRAYLPWFLPDGYDSWLTLHFLRSYTALNSFERARRAAQLDEHTAGMAQVLTQLVLRIAALLTLMAGTIFTFEVLGDPPWIRDSYLETSAGDKVSFFQMVYWIVVTITTVGYGDFAPATVIARTLTTGFIVIGVATIYFIQFSFSEMRKQQHEGTGRYWQRSWGRERHVVVVLCHHGSASRMASLIHGFLQELLHASHNQLEDHHDHASSIWAHIRLWLRGAPPRHVQTWPDVVFLSPTRWEEERRGASFRDFLSAAEDFPSNMQRRVWFLVGQITSETDLERARVRDSALTYVLSDLRSTSPEEDDGQTVYSALCIRDLFPEVRLRLMVMKPESKELAVQAGIEATRVFSSHELSASLLAQNVRCRGLIPAVTAMLKSADADDEEYFLRHAVLTTSRKGSKTGLTQEHGDSQSSGRQPMAKLASTSSSMLENCRTLDEIEKVLRKSQTKWCPEKQAYERRDPWMFEYFEGAEKTVFGMALNSRYEGLSYGALVTAIYRESGALVLGVQSHGVLILCPQGRRWRAKAGQICFAVAPSADSLDPCRWDAEDRTTWRTRFQEARRKRRRKAHGEGRHVAAAHLMGWRLHRSLLRPGEEARAEAPGIPGGASGSRGDQQWCAMPRGRQNHDQNFGQDGLLHAEAVRRPPSPAVRPLAPPKLQTLETLREESLDDQHSNVSEDSPRLNHHLPPSMVAPLQNSLGSALQSRVKRSLWGSGELGEALTARSLRSSLGSGDELVVLIVCNGETWQQVRTFCSTLRQAHLPCLQPLVILAPTRPPPNLLEDFADSRLVFVRGSCLDAQALIEAGVLEASAVVAMTGEPAHHRQSSDFRTCDYRMVLTAHELECWLGPSPKEVFTTFELHHSRSARHLPRLQGRHCNSEQGKESLQGLMTRQSSSSTLHLERAESGEAWDLQRQHSTFISEDGSEQGRQEQRLDSDSPSSGQGRGLNLLDTSALEHRLSGSNELEQLALDELSEEESEDDEKLGSGIEDQGHDRRSFWTWLRLFRAQGAELERSHDSILYHPRFSAGQVFSPELWGMMLGRMFYMPAVIELMEALVMGARHGQQSFPWQVRVPPRYIGRPFSELVADLASGALYRRSDEDESFGAEDRKEPKGPPSVPLALYRLNDDFHPCDPSVPLGSMQSDPSGRMGTSSHRLTAKDVTDSATATSRTLAEGTGGFHFVVLCPPRDMALRRGDWVVVLGGAIFGRRMHERGLLRGGSVASQRTVEAL